MFDLLIHGGWVIDGTGGPPFRADVGLIDTMIGAVGRLEGVEAPRVLDATGLYVAPGFIDAHVHGDAMLLADPVHLPALRQGVTTYILGQDGSSFAPASPATLEYMRRYTAGFNGNPDGVGYDWNSIDEYLRRFDRNVAINVAYLIPNGNVRMEVKGLDPGPASADELAAMRRLVREGMEAGAVGLSSGLDYIPSRFADATELAALCEEVAAQDGIYVTHMRGYGAMAPVGMAEVVETARRSGVAAHVSHYNGAADLLIPLVDSARALGVDLTFDTYPYLAGSTILGMVALPPWVQEGGIDATVARLRDPAIRARLNTEWFSKPTPYALDQITLAMVADPSRRWAEGWKLTEAAEKEGRSPGDFVCEVLADSGMAVGIVGFRPGERTDDDVRAILRHPSHMAGSDGIYCGGFPHPRGWGAFARYLGRHTRELGDYDWASAVTHLASHAARRFRLADRGLVRPGFAADLALFDPATVADRSTYAAGRTLAEGVRHVFVNGTLALLDGEPTGATPGRALRRGS
ncbi:MAG TPA: D-aminoacylase [Isosphaeraceae bacterium]|jgi:N-acyl-D-amino-acid deacylase|nr:D-aminoacylase [Isosphaeraceae bacterium]